MPSSSGRFRKNLPFLLTLFLIICFRWSFADQYHIPSGSMEPTLEVGDHILVDKRAYELRWPFTRSAVMTTGLPRRGDVIVFEHPATGVLMVKRLVALPGDRVSVRDGFVRINGRSLPVRFLGETENGILIEETHSAQKARIKRSSIRPPERPLEFTVPEDRFFALGDNRDNSLDSRSWGLIPRDRLKGKARGVLWNVSWKNGLRPVFRPFPEG